MNGFEFSAKTTSEKLLNRPISAAVHGVLENTDVRRSGIRK